MGLISPWGLLGLISLPLIVLLWLLKRRRTDQPVASTFLWRQVLEEAQVNAPWQRLRRHLLLLLQLLAALLFALALTRPYLPAGQGGKSHLALLVDLSGSMQAEDRFAQAQAEAKRLIDQLGPFDTATLIAVGQEPQIRASGGNKGELRRALSELTPTYGTADFNQALSLVAALAEQEVGLRGVLLTDQSIEAPDLGFPLDVLTFNRGEPNLAVAQLVVDGDFALARVQVTAGPGGPFQLELYADGQLVATRAAEVGPNETAEVIWRPVPPAAAYEARLVADDALAADNQAFAVAGGSQERSILLVSDGNRFLEKALALSGRLTVTKPANYTPGAYDLYVFEGYLPNELPPGRLISINPPAGTFELGEPEGVGRLRVEPGSFLADLPVADVNIARARPYQGTALKPQLTSGGLPLLLTGHWQGRSIGLLPFDLNESDLPLRLAFPLLVQGLVAEVSPARPVPPALVVGEATPIALSPLTTAARVEGPIDLPVGDHFAGAPLPGLYRLIEEQPGGRLEHPLAVNFPVAAELGQSSLSAPVGGAPTVAERVGNTELWRGLALVALLVVVAEWLVYRRQQRPQRLYLWVRGGLVTLLLAALLVPELAFTVRRQAVVFVADRSASAMAHGSEIDRFIHEAVAQKGEEDLAGVVSFGRSALVDVPVGPTVGALGAQPSPHFTDIARGLRLGRALLPDGYRQRLVLLSDGEANRGDLTGAVAELARQGVRVDLLPLAAAGGGLDVAVDEVQLSPRLFEGEQAQLTVALMANGPAEGVLRVYLGRDLVHSETVAVAAGRTQLSLPLPGLPPGQHRVRVTFAAPGDRILENNEGAALTRVEGAPRILLVRSTEEDGADLTANLTSLGLPVTAVAPALLPSSVEELRSYSVVILANVPSWTLPEGAMTALESYVREFGGGLVMVGGENSYALGAYQGTPIEAALPVTMDLRNKGEVPSVALMLVIDRSGSMSGEKMGLAREGAARSAALLTADDQLGVIAFDSSPAMVWPLGYLTDQAAAMNAIGSIREGGGTDIYPAVAAAYNALLGAEAKLKHIILLTDGQAPDGNWAGLTAQMEAAGITLSSVAVGADSDQRLLTELAQLGGGRYYYADQAADLPEIFLKETMLASRPYIVDLTFTPLAGSASPVLTGLSEVGLLHGYVGTSLKGPAEAALLSTEGDPVLAHWQYGLGRAAAWTPDAKGRWARDWLGTEPWSLLWSNLISWLLPPASGGQLQVESSFVDGRVTLSAVDASGAAGVVPTKAFVLGLEGEGVEVSLTPSGLGRYSAVLDDLEPGAYLVQVQQVDADGGVVTASGGWVVPYSPEYRLLPTGALGGAGRSDDDAGAATALPAPLADLLARTGGKVLTSPAEAFAADLPPAKGRFSLFPWLLGLVAVLWLFDVVLRRLGTAWLSFAWVAGLLRRPQPAVEGEASVLADRLGRYRSGQRALSSARVSTAQTASPGSVAAQPSADSAEPRQPSPPRPEVAELKQPAKPAANAPVEPNEAASQPAVQAKPQRAKPETQPADGDEDFTSRLLAAKRRRR